MITKESRKLSWRDWSQSLV